MSPSQPLCIAWKFTSQNPERLHLLNLAPAPTDLDEACSMLPSGIYTTLRTFKGSSTLRLEDHIRRLEEGAKLTGQEARVSRRAVRKLILASLTYYTPADIRLRLILDTTMIPGDLYLAAMRFEPIPASLYSCGVPVVTVDSRRENPTAKVTGYLAVGSGLRSSSSDKAYEVLLAGENGEILEGTSSNFYTVINGEVFTASEGVLPGITRSLILDEARLANLVIHDHGVYLSEIPQIEEAFLSSSTRGIIPVISINEKQVGKGTPGIVTRLLMRRYRERIDQELESLSSSTASSSSPPVESSTSSPRS